MEYNFYNDPNFMSFQNAQIDLTSCLDSSLCNYCATEVIKNMNFDHKGHDSSLIPVSILSATARKFLDGVRLIIKFIAEGEMGQIEVEGHLYFENGVLHVMGFFENLQSVHTQPDTSFPLEIGSLNEPIIDTSGFIISRSGQPPDLVVDNPVEVDGNKKTDIGMVIIRGNSVVTVEALGPAPGTQ